MLSQKQIEELLNILKKAEYNQSTFIFPDYGEKEIIEAYSLDKRKKFLIDITPGKSKRRKYKMSYQERYKKDIILLRLDLNGPPHTNPDGTLVSGNHLHIIKEGYDDKFAIEVPDNLIAKDNNVQTLINFLEYCKIINNSDFANIQRRLPNWANL